jgi:hypothetical protein
MEVHKSQINQELKEVNDRHTCLIYGSESSFENQKGKLE